MQTKNYWVGDRPRGAWVFQVLDQKTGQVQDLTGYTSATVLLLDPQNKSVDLLDGNTFISNATAGQVTFVWPSTSLFTKTGRYTMQVQLDGTGVSRKTTEQDILVRRLGGVTN